MASQYMSTGPLYGSGNSVVTGAASTAATAFGGGGGDYLFYAGTTPAYILCGNASVGAATTATAGFDLIIPAGWNWVYTIPPSWTHFRVISTGAGTLSWGKVGQ